MCLKDKINLENLIFARASYLHVPVYAKYGGLIVPSEDKLLQYLLYVYNACFRAYNFAHFCTPHEPLAPYQNYLAQCPRPPGFTCLYHRGELNFELILSEGK